MNKINIDVRGPIYPVIRIKIPLIKANSRFEAGPANAIFIMSTLGFAKYLESTGTGFAQPKPTNKIISEPKGSRWAIGFKVNLPWCFAVGSPSLYATHPCENSWKTNAKSSTGINNAKTSGCRRNSTNQTLDEKFYAPLLNALCQGVYKFESLIYRHDQASLEQT